MGAWDLGVQEAVRQAGRFDAKILAVLTVLAVAAGGLVALAPPDAPQPAAGLWVVESTPDALLRPAADSEPRFRVVLGDGSRFEAGDADLFLQADRLLHRPTDRSRAAVEALESAARRWLDDRLAGEEDEDAAFPVIVTLAYEPRIVPVSRAGGGDGGGGGGDGGGGDGDGGDGGDGDGGDGGDGDGGAGGDGDGGDGEAGDGAAPDPQDVLADARPSSIQPDLRPDDVDPPFPIRSLLLTFAYVVPAGLLAQVHAANLHGERTRRRGTMLLAAPVGPATILLGKSLPALALTVALAASITLWLGAGWLGLLASLAFLAFLFSATTFLAVISRNPRELGMSQVAVTTLLNVFLFLPAMFPSIPPVAFLSPIHVVASGIRGEAVTLGQFLYATLPLGLAAGALAAVSVGLMREELLFAVRSSVSRLLDAVEQVSRAWWRVLAAGILVVPFVFAGEILVLVLAAVLGVGAAIVVWLPLSVLMEEAAKGLPIWARHRPGSGMRTAPWLLGSLVGIGFFLGEKSYLVLTLVGFESLPFGREALALLGTGPGIVLLAVPLALHVATGIMLAYGSARGRGPRYAAFAGASAVHLAYDQILLGGVL